MKILVAEEDGDLRASVVEFLAGRGVDVLEASDGPGVLRHVTQSRLRAAELDAVVMDLALPRANGIDVLRRIRESYPDLAVVVATGRLDPAVSRQARALGARAVLLKPLDVNRMWDALAGGAPAASPQARTARVLVVDDDPDMRETIVEFLSSRGHRTTTASDALAAVRLLGEGPYDVVLLDLNMPGLSGADALPTIRAIAPNARVVMVTGNTDRHEATRTRAYGAFDYLVKPINWNHLAETVAMALDAEAPAR